LLTNSSFIRRKKERDGFIKIVHPEKRTLAKNVLDSRPRINWSKTQIVEFENDFRKNRFVN